MNIIEPLKISLSSFDYETKTNWMKTKYKHFDLDIEMKQ